MNILVPHHWLLDHLKTRANSQEMQKYLSLSGPSVENISKTEGDKVYDIEVTTNRVDAMSVRGIAREAAVILSQYNLASQLKPLKLKQTNKLEIDEFPLPKINNDPQLCQRIMCVAMKDVKQKDSPKWLQKRLKQAGFQLHSNLIDITNYITHDLGHPCHVFDYDKIMNLGGVINITEAKEGKPFVTLDGMERETVGGEIVFTNEIGTIIDLPAIIGTANSSVDKNTKNILFWIEDLDAQRVRQASIRHAIRTNAAQLNEKNVDPHLAEEALLKGIDLYQKLTNARVASKIFDEFPDPRKVAAFELKQQTLKNYLGISLETKQVEKILSSLGCEVEVLINSSDQKDQTVFKIQPPTYRPDLQIPADAIEEIARIYGYQNLPSELMTGELPTNKPKKINFKIEDKIRQFLSHIGWQEIYSISLVSKELALQSGFELEKHLKLSNPLTTENEYLRRSLIPSLQEAMLANPQAENLSVFELAAVYHPIENELPKQSLKIGLVSNKNYRKFRGDLEALLKQFYITGMSVVSFDKDSKNSSKNETAPFIRQHGKIMIKNQNNQINIGEIYLLDNNHLAAQLDYQKILKLAKKYPNYQPRVKTSPIIEDLTFTLSPQTKVGDIIKTICNLDQLITSATLTDVYQQNFTFEIKYQDPTDNLASEDLQPIRKKLVEQIEDKFQAKLVGQI